MKNIYRLLSLMLLLLTWVSCTPDVTDDTVFKLYYFNVSLTLGEDYVSQPSYLGKQPHSFEIYAISCDGKVWYNPKLDGKLTEDSHFYVNPDNGNIIISKTTDMTAGTYKVSISCVSDGVAYTYPDLITVKLNKAK